ncbi:MAG TPA: hypothetical protein VIW29_14030 [Polyangiaceae bacterium]
MPAFAKASLSLLALLVLEVACGNPPLPPTEPPPSAASPATRTNDTPVAAPITGAPLLASGGSNALPTPPAPPSGGTQSGSAP